MKKVYGIYFNAAFLAAIDIRLTDHYNEHIKREDFLHFFYLIETSKENYVELPSNVRTKFGKYTKDNKRHWRFKEIVDICEKNDIIVSTSYSTDHKYCKSYGYTVDFVNSIFDLEVNFQFCEISEKLYHIIFNMFKANKANKVPSDKMLKQHYNLMLDIEIDLDKAIEYTKTLDQSKFLRVVRQIINMYFKQGLFVVQDNKTGRIFSSFNMMKKELREFCTIEGTQLDSVDLTSSQPYFLSSILMKEHPNNKEVKRFYELIINNDLYEWVIDKLKLNITRKEAKVMFFSYLYKKNNGTNEVQQIMMKEFNEVYELIKIKKRSEELWQTLQTVEADIFVSTANEMKCLSVHDSVYFRQTDRRQVLECIDNKLQQTGFSNYKLT